MEPSSRTLRGNPYWLFSRFRFRELQLRAYIVREHRAGRRLADILSDPYVRRFGPDFSARIIVHPLTIAALERNDAEAIAAYNSPMAGSFSPNTARRPSATALSPWL